jgi:hypothetical protein
VTAKDQASTWKGHPTPLLPPAFVRRKLAANIAIDHAFVGMQTGFPVNVLANDLGNLSDGRLDRIEGTDLEAKAIGSGA